MAKRTYGTVNVKQIELSEKEVYDILVENLDIRTDEHYNFAHKSPIVIRKDSGGYIFRFVADGLTDQEDVRIVDLKPIKRMEPGEN